MIRDTSSRHHHHIIRGIIRIDILEQIFARDALNVVHRAENGASQRTILKTILMQMIENELFLRLAVHILHLLQDHASLALNCLLVQQRITQNIRQNVHRLIGVFTQHLRIIHRLFARRVRIQMAAQILHFHLELFAGTFARTFERQMLQEMCTAIVLLSLVARACVDEDANRDCIAVPRQVLRRDTQTILESGNLAIRPTHYILIVADVAIKWTVLLRHQRLAHKRLQVGQITALPFVTVDSAMRKLSLLLMLWSCCER
mmetsp:Transcript_13935/g.21007  ORF Transcript_13935/g.21007 Transcript_13935/m.21007 type:complete len:260 (-) Transcript_13935:147-926(-)